MIPRCKHLRARELAHTVRWCPECGAHKRLERERWTKWVPCGVQRLRPLKRGEAAAAVSKMRSDLRQLELPESFAPPLPSFTPSTCDHCGEPEAFNVLCPACEELCCSECGRVECVCRPQRERVSARRRQLQTLHLVQKS